MSLVARSLIGYFDLARLLVVDPAGPEKPVFWVLPFHRRQFASMLSLPRRGKITCASTFPERDSSMAK